MVNRKQPAILDAAHRVLVNHEVYFFGSDAAKNAFVANPRKWCGKVTDPVTRERFHPKKSSPATTYSGRLYYFRSAESREAFLAMPEMYKDPTRTMPAM